MWIPNNIEIKKKFFSFDERKNIYVTELFFDGELISDGVEVCRCDGYSINLVYDDCIGNCVTLRRAGHFVILIPSFKYLNKIHLENEPPEILKKKGCPIISYDYYLELNSQIEVLPKFEEITVLNFEEVIKIIQFEVPFFLGSHYDLPKINRNEFISTSDGDSESILQEIENYFLDNINDSAKVTLIEVKGSEKINAIFYDIGGFLEWRLFPNINFGDSLFVEPNFIFKKIKEKN